jgi:hypothetical protein
MSPTIPLRGALGLPGAAVPHRPRHSLAYRLHRPLTRRPRA